MFTAIQLIGLCEKCSQEIVGQSGGIDGDPVVLVNVDATPDLAVAVLAQDEVDAGSLEFGVQLAEGVGRLEGKPGQSPLESFELVGARLVILFEKLFQPGDGRLAGEGGGLDRGAPLSTLVIGDAIGQPLGSAGAAVGTAGVGDDIVLPKDGVEFGEGGHIIVLHGIVDGRGHGGLVGAVLTIADAYGWAKGGMHGLFFLPIAGGRQPEGFFDGKPCRFG